MCLGTVELQSLRQVQASFFTMELTLSTKQRYCLKLGQSLKSHCAAPATCNRADWHMVPELSVASEFLWIFSACCFVHMLITPVYSTLESSGCLLNSQERKIAMQAFSQSQSQDHILEIMAYLILASWTPHLLSSLCLILTYPQIHGITIFYINYTLVLLPRANNVWGLTSLFLF